MLLKSCNRCGRLMPYGLSYCETCTPIVEEYREARRLEANRQYNKKRDPKYLRFYNSIDWKTLSLKYLADKGYRCELCGTIATEVHHKVFIQTPEGWELRFDYDNLEALCTQCHNRRHNRFTKKNFEKRVR